MSATGLVCAFVFRVLSVLPLAAIAVAPQSQAQERAGVAAKPSPDWVGNPRIFPIKTGDAAAWDKRWWIEKTARLLRGGEGLGPDDDVEALAALSEEAIVRRFMADPRFGDTILDFNLFFLGFKPDSLKTRGAYDRGAFDFANAVGAAQAVLAGGDYFKLFDLEGPLYLAPLRVVPEDPPAPHDHGLSQTRLRAKAISELRAAVADVLAYAAGPERPNGDEFCEDMQGLVARRAALRDAVFRAFDDSEIFVLRRGQVLTAPFDALAKVTKEECYGQDEDDVDVPRLAAVLRTALAQFDRAFAEIVKFDAAAYRPRSVGEFRAFDLGALPDSRPWLAFGYEQAIALANSSTNLNRKRAAYVLKRFFCDDVVASPPKPPEPHANGAEASCSACHTKLDPMAGFFRGYGAQFFDYGRMPAIVFDDLAFKNRGEYESAWRAPPDAGREWNIGYVRSSSAPGGNAYGRTLADLSRIIRTAPEVKRCLVKRLFEYMVAEGQMIEGGYLDHLTREFERESAVNASAALKNTIVRIAESRTFRQRNPEARQCYDYAPGANPEGQPPCRVAFVLKKNCTGCHDSAESGDASLDLSARIAAPDGRSRTFPHLDRFMDQMPAEDTLAKIVERLSTRDPKQRMPKNRSMRHDEREELTHWARQELARIRQRSGR